MMKQKKVIVLGPTSAGKSWISNKILGKDMCKVAKYSAQCTMEVEKKEKPIRNPEDGEEYQLELYDTPGFETKHQSVLRTLEENQFDQIVIVVPMAKQIEGKSEEALENVRSICRRSIKNSPSSFTIVVNKSTSGYSESDSFAFLISVKKMLKLSDSCGLICVKHDEKIVDCFFTYMGESEDGESYFSSANFLKKVIDSAPKAVIESAAAARRQKQPAPTNRSSPTPTPSSPSSQQTRSIAANPSSECDSSFLFSYKLFIFIMLVFILGAIALILVTKLAEIDVKNAVLIAIAFFSAFIFLIMLQLCILARRHTRSNEAYLEHGANLSTRPLL